MANTYQSSGIRGNGRNAEFMGTPAVLAASPITGNMVLKTIAVHQLPDGTFAVTNGMAITALDSGEIDAINASLGYQSIEPAVLLAALKNAQGVYTCDAPFGSIFGTLDGRLIHLAPSDAREFGVEATNFVHTAADGTTTTLEGCIVISVPAYLALFEIGAKGATPPAQLTFRQGKTFDVFPYSDGLRIARAENPLAEATVTDRTGAEIVIRAFPRGNQRSSMGAARREEAIATSPLATLSFGRKPASMVAASAAPAAAAAPRGI
jgi:hypothetical protein